MSNIKTPKLNNELVSFVVGVLLGFFICLFTFPKFMDSTLYWTLVVLWGVLFPGYYYINYFLFKRKNQWMQLFVFAFMALIFCISIYSVLQDNVDIQANLNLFLILMFTMVFNMTVVFHYDFEESVVALGALLDKVIFIACGAAFGVGFRLFLTYFWGETDPPQESLSLERKVFYGIKTTYYFFLTLSGAFIWRRKKALKKVSEGLIISLIIPFLIYIAFNIYFSIAYADYSFFRLGIVQEFLSFIMIISMLTLSALVYNKNLEFEALKSPLDKIFRNLLVVIFMLLAFPWILLYLINKMQGVKDFFFTEQKGLIVIVISSIITSVVSSVIVMKIKPKE